MRNKDTILLENVYEKILNEYKGSYYAGANFDQPESDEDKSKRIEAENIAYEIVKGVYHWGAKGYENSGAVLRASNPYLISKQDDGEITRYKINLTLPFSILFSSKESDENYESLTDKYSEDFRDGIRSTFGNPEAGGKYTKGSLLNVEPLKDNPSLGSFTVSFEAGRNI